MLRHQLPVYSPLSLRALAGALADVARPSDPLAELGRALERRFGADAAVLFGSGTQALQRAIELAREGAGGDSFVALPAFACFDVATAAVGAGAPVVLYDIDPHTLAPDLESFERACQAGARVAVVAHFYGMPVDWERVDAIAAAHGVLLIEDAAQGHGGSWRNRPLGSLGGLAILSFGRGKGWTGMGGGALLLRGRKGFESPSAPAPAARVGASGRALAAALLQLSFGRPGLYQLPRSLPWLALGETRYRPPRSPTAMARAAAALVLQTERAAEAAARLRQAAGDEWAAAVAGFPGASPIRPILDGRPGYLRFPMHLPRGFLSFRDRSLAARLGIAPSYPCSLGDLRPLRHLLRDPADARLPGARALAQTLITLPTHPLLRPRERRAILDLLRSAGA